MDVNNPGIWHFLDFEIVSYRKAWDFQHSILNAKKQGSLKEDIVLLLEHQPVFTMGRRGGSENLRISECLLEQSGIEVIYVERGGNITFHGPGQLIGYPIVDLRRNGIGVADYVRGLEEVMIRTAGEWHVRAERNSLNRGAWVGNRKLGSIGIAVQRGVSFHGFALNVNVSLKPYEWINPCGLENIRMTSIEQFNKSGTEVSIKSAKAAVKKHMADVFRIKLAPLPPEIINIDEMKSI